MKAEELMIGDWLYSIIFNQTQQEKPVKVVGIRTDCDDTYLQCDDTDTWYHIETYRPIPLPEELMTKNFPEYDPGYEIGWWQNEDKTSFQVEWQSKDAEVVLRNVKYVHELQHFLRLLHIDREIVL